MSNSTDSLKKKVCVTVFLDELFEEVPEEERGDLKQVIGSEEKHAGKPKPSPIEVVGDGKVDVSSDADTEIVSGRVRKHRKELKFSGMRYDSFHKELCKYGYSSCVKLGSEGWEQVESAGSDSDFDLDEFLELDPWAFQSSGRSSSEPSEVDMTEESFLSIDPILSSMMITPKEEATLEGDVESSLSCNKSTQFDGVDCFEKEKQRAAEEVLAWEDTQRQIQLILAKAKSSRMESWEGGRIQRYDLKSILEECLRKEGTTNIFAEGVSPNMSSFGIAQELSDSYTCVFPHNRRKTRSRDSEVKVWTRRNVWNDGFESDLSEADCSHFTNGIDLRAIQNDPLLCYALCLDCKNSVHENKEKEENQSSSALLSAPDCGSTSWESSFESIKSKTSRDMLFRAVTHLANKTVLEAILTSEQGEEETRNEGDVSVESHKRVEGRNKNFAEGDTVEQPILDFESKEKLLLCDEMYLKNVEEAKVIHNEIIVNRAEIEYPLNPQGAKPKQETPSSSTLQGLPKVLFKQTPTGSTIDAESEMVFPERESSCENGVFFGEKYYDSPESPSPGKKTTEQEIRIVEFEGKLSRSKVLKRMKTVEILGNDSLKDMKNISTEVILICEDISDSEVCLEAWQNSTSTLRSFTEMGQCYLKDSKDSAMYLIEIPLHFTSEMHGREQPSKSQDYFKAPDSE